MVQQLQPESLTGSVYPDSDGQPMADNTLQFEWIVTIKENLELVFADRDDVFVAGDLLWCSMEGNNKLRWAPDTMVAVGRPKGYRGSYQQWQEGNIAPQVVFEVLSPSTTLKELAEKFQFYDRYGVEKYYLFDPYDTDLSGWQRDANQRLAVIEGIETWTSPRLGIQFRLARQQRLQILTPDGTLFLTLPAGDGADYCSGGGGTRDHGSAGRTALGGFIVVSA